MKALLALALLAAGALLADGPATPVVFKALAPEKIQHRLEMVVPGMAERRATLQSLFEEVGCSGERLTSQKVPGSKYPNLICTLPGTDPYAGVIVASAHFDYIGGGIGAVDDWSGAVLLPSLYESLAPVPRRHTFVFAAFSAEHLHMAGSARYLGRLSKQRKREIRAVVNLESLGLTVAHVWAMRANPKLLDACYSTARSMDLDFREANLGPGMDDDSRPFWMAGIPVITIHSTNQETVGFIHSPKDQLNAIDQKNYFQAYRLIAGFLAFLDAQPR